VDLTVGSLVLLGAVVGFFAAGALERGGVCALRKATDVCWLLGAGRGRGRFGFGRILARFIFGGSWGCVEGAEGELVG